MMKELNMKLKGKQVEDFIKALDESDKMNKTAELAKENESEDEEEVPVSVVEVIKKCSCGGEFKYTPGMTQTLEYPPHYTHTCNKCGKVERFLKTYPYQRFKRNDR